MSMATAPAPWVGSPREFFPYLAMSDAIHAHERALVAPSSVQGIFNIHTENITVGEAARRVCEYFKTRRGQAVDVFTKHIPDARNYRVSHDRAVRELDSSGITRRDIAAPLTAAQKRQKQAEEEKRKAGEAAAAEQKQTDHAIMARYRNDADVGTARKRTLDIVQEQMKRELASLAVAEKAYKGSQAEIGLIKNKKDVPAGLQRKLEEFEQAVRNGKKKIQEQEIEIAQINAKYDAELARFRELSGTAAAK